MMLSLRESQILQLVAIGQTPEEIGDKLFISPGTVRKTICNIKQKLNLQKATELTAFFWCNLFHVDFAEKRKQILSATLSVMILIAGSFLDSRRLRHRQRHCRRIDKIEYKRQIETQ
jgi:DNA-binding CsgD family transcriptional regulator